ncbi:MAG: low-specificity L-threonine aldolase [Aeromicrobium sp.]|nr:low-specificity L-threonine aldolase [Burkholderiales bacterium]
MKKIDLRSDTVTRPTAAMRAVMANAEVGDDVFGDDPTVNALQEKMADMVGMEAGLFMPSGTQSNLCALMAHCARGEEYIVGQNAHTYKYEGGGAAVLGSIQPQPIENAADGTIPLEKIRAAVKPDDSHFAITRLISLENTIGGMVIPESYMAEVSAFAKERSLAMHLDGARLFNAVVKTRRSAKDICGVFDSVSVCLSKGLGTPAGSVLCGTKALIKRAQRHRKMLGGGMRQVGILAAACIHALDHHVDRLEEDHKNAAQLAVGLAEIAPLTVHMPQTNILFVEVQSSDVAALQAHLDQHGIIAIVGPRTRIVTHLDVGTDDVQRIVDVIAAYYRGHGS